MMSKYVKYISSAHFGAPVMKGDRWGYCVEMLRTCLVTGFNERTDLTNVEVLTAETVKYTFTTEHNYVENQTIKVKDVSLSILNGDALVISSTSNTVTCKIYNDVSAHIGTSLAVIASAKVAPLGFTEKFTDPAGRSVFVTDEINENAYFYIDDTKPTNWVDNGTYTQLIAPIVFMTDKMSDIDTVTGRYIVPYDSSNPTYYKQKDYTVGTSSCNGMMNFISYGSSNVNGNTAAQRITPMSYTIIGNGRMFYFIPDTNVTTVNTNNKFIFGFGKYKSNNTLLDNPYILFGNMARPASANGYKDYNRSTSPYLNRAYSEQIGEITDATNVNTDIGRYNNAILKANNTPSIPYFSPTFNMTSTTDYGSQGIASGVSALSYPEINTKKFFCSSIKLYNKQKYFGTLSGLLWTFNVNSIVFTHNIVIKFKQNNKDKRMYIYKSNMGINISSTATQVVTHAISFDYEEWGNYD